MNSSIVARIILLKFIVLFRHKSMGRYPEFKSNKRHVVTAMLYCGQFFSSTDFLRFKVQSHEMFFI